jgi:hypothetical protein
MKLTLTGVTPDFYLEFVVMKNLTQEFRELGFNFTKAYPHAVIEDEENIIFAECDITLENNDTVMIVEVISVPTEGDISEHIERLKKIRAYASLHRDNRVFLGAVAGMIVNGSVRDFALKNGLFMIEPAESEPRYDQAEYAGETFTVTAPEGNCSLENGRVSGIFPEDFRHPPATQVFPAAKTVFPSPSRNKHPNKYARQS